MNSENKNKLEESKMNKEACSCQNKVNAFLDGELESTEYSQMKEHIMSCPSCQQELRELKKVNEELSAWEDVEVPEALYSSILAEAARLTPRGHVKLWRSLSNLSIAASVLLALFMGVLMNSNIANSNQYTTETESSYEVAFDSYSILSYLGDE